MSDAETDLIPLAEQQPDPAPLPEATGPDEDDTDLVIATGLDHGTGVHRVYAGLDFRLPADTLGVVHGTDGSGRSTLLLALIGRAGGIAGSLQVAGHDALRPTRALRDITTAARIGTVVDLEPKHSVADALADRAATDGLRTAAARTRYAELAETLSLRLSPTTLVEQLDALHRTVLSLALAALRPSTLIVLDDAHRGLDLDDQRRLYQTIRALMTHTGSTVVVSTVEASTVPDDAVVIDLPAPGSGR